MKTLDTLAERAAFAREVIHLTQERIANEIGMTQQGYADIESGKSLQPRKLNKIAEILKVSAQWLQFGSGSGPVSLERMRDVHSRIPPNKIPIIDWQDVQRWVIDSAEPVFKQEWNFIDFSKKNSKIYALLIQNDAMVGHPKSFSPGEIIVIDPTRDPENGEYVIILQGGSSKPIFRQWITDGDKTHLKPLNKQYPTETMTLKDTVCGVMIDRREG